MALTVITVSRFLQNPTHQARTKHSQCELHLGISGCIHVGQAHTFCFELSYIQLKSKKSVRAPTKSRTCVFSSKQAHFLAFLFVQAQSLRKHVYSNILKILPPKSENFQIKNSDIFLIYVRNIDCGYSLEPPRRGGSNEYSQSMFLSRNKKIMYTPVNPSFTV